MQYRVEKSTITGQVMVPTSKSHTMRAILFASLGTGTSFVRSPLPSPDTIAMVAACKAIGATMEEINENGYMSGFCIQGTGGVLTVPKQVIDVGNSGQVLRFVSVFAALMPLYTVITGDTSVCTIRPMNPLLDALTQLGAFAVSSKKDGHAPIIIKGPVHAGTIRMDGKDSQPVSAMLMLGGFLQGTTTILVDNPGEQPWIDLTLYWLDRLGIKYTNKNYEKYTVEGAVSYNGFDYTVPGDWSSVAFPIAAALIQNVPITLLNMDVADPQGDKAILQAFEQMGATFTVYEAEKKIEVHTHNGLHGIKINVNHIIDAVPILATVACFAKSPTIISGAEIARHKECDRLHAIACELAKMGAYIEELPDGLHIQPATLHGAVTSSWHDHRIAMSIAVAGLTCGGTVIDDTACVAKSFPDFARIMGNLGATIIEEN